jgi:hypothetical protein
MGGWVDVAKKHWDQSWKMAKKKSHFKMAQG